MKSGTSPTRIDHRDRDLFGSFGISTTTFPTEFLTDAGLGIPDQNADGQPYGCTNYTQAELDTDLSEGTKVSKPIDLENVTHANKNGGFGIRESLLAAKRLGWFGGFYAIKARGFIDWFDAFRLAQVSALPEKRSISVGLPWFGSWSQAMTGRYVTKNPNGTLTYHAGVPQAVLPMPTPEELQEIRRYQGAFGFFRGLVGRLFGQASATPTYTWHNAKLDGWTYYQGQLVYRCKPWQGTAVGNGGWVYLTRDVLNTVMAIPGTCAFTATNLEPEKIATIDTNAVTWVISLIRNLLKL